MWWGGVLEPGSICSQIYNCISSVFEMFKNSDKKLRVRLDILWVNEVVSSKTDSFCIVCKKRLNLVSKMAFNETVFCLFYKDHKKYRFCTKFVVHTQNVEMFMLNFCSEIFDIPKYFFQWARAYAPMFRNEFPLYMCSPIIVKTIFCMVLSRKPRVAMN